MLGETICINNSNYRIVGVLHEIPAEYSKQIRGPQEDYDIIIPLSTFNSLYEWTEDYTATVITGTERNEAKTGSKLKHFLKSAFGINEGSRIEYYREKVERDIKYLNDDAKETLLLGIVAMLAGGIGIMNVMLSVMYSRIREIGVRRALGASKADILIQFLAEVGILGFLGGLSGITLGLCAVIFLTPPQEEIFLAWWVIPASLFISVATSLIFAVYPALKAADLSPAESLKYE
jgi:ABC-type antimicrobial peptide transport system, permease component